MTREEDEMLEQVDSEALKMPTFKTPAMLRAEELARELLRQRGYSDDEIAQELNKPPGSGIASF